MHLWLMSKSTIFAVVNATIFWATMVKMTCNQIFDYKTIWSCICDYDLQLILVWMKMKMKDALISSMFSGIKKDGNAVFTTHDVIHEPLNTTWHVLMQFDSQL